MHTIQSSMHNRVCRTSRSLYHAYSTTTRVLVQYAEYPYYQLVASSMNTTSQSMHTMHTYVICTLASSSMDTSQSNSHTLVRKYAQEQLVCILARVVWILSLICIHSTHSQYIVSSICTSQYAYYAQSTNNSVCILQLVVLKTEQACRLLAGPTSRQPCHIHCSPKTVRSKHARNARERTLNSNADKPNALSTAILSTTTTHKPNALSSDALTDDIFPLLYYL